MEDPVRGDTIARLMADFRRGDTTAANRLIELLYPELRRLAAAKMKGERNGHTWQPTLLINELYLSLVKIRVLRGDAATADEEKSAFLGLAGQIMKRLLIDHSRPLYRRAARTEIGYALSLGESSLENLQSVEQALTKLAAIDPKLRTVTEMRVFEGFTGEEIAQQLGCSPRTVANYWAFAKRWLDKELAA
jgi:RNA polymerase sigma factor (TIGR02999 family)